MSAWNILSALGFYQVAPGNQVHNTGCHVFEGVRIRTGNGWFTIKTHNSSRENKYIGKIVLNGRVLSEPRFRHEDIKTGGMLEFYMANEPML